MLQASHKSFDPCPQNFRDFEARSVVMARGVGSVSSVTWLVYCSTRFMPTLFCTTAQAHFAFVDPCCVGAATNPRFEYAMFGHAQVVHTNATHGALLGWAGFAMVNPRLTSN